MRGNKDVSVVKDYGIGVSQLDRVRYPDYTLVGGLNNWGDNPTALRRYRKEISTPLPRQAISLPDLTLL